MKNIKLAAFFMCFLLASSGCSTNSKSFENKDDSDEKSICESKDSDKKDSDDGESEVSDSTYESDVIIDVDDFVDSYEVTIPYTDEQQKLLSQTVDIKEFDGLEALTDEIAEYPLLDIADIDSAYQRYLTLPEVDNNIEYGIITDLPLDPQELFEIVDKNTDNALASQSLYGKSKLNEEDMMFCCEYICKTLNAELENHPYTDHLDDIDANLANLTMYEGMGLDNAAIYEDGSMTFSKAMCENMIWVTGFEDAPMQIVAHETEHLLQKTSVKNRDAMGVSKSYGFMVAWDDMEINPLYLNWMIEGAAERLSVNLYQGVPYTYASKVAYIDSISFIAMLNGYEADDFSQTTQQAGYDIIFEMFRCGSDSEKAELLNMLYANEIIQSEPEDFMSAYEAKIGHQLSETELVNLKIELKAALLTTLSRYFYRDLAQLVTSGELTFEQVCFIVAGWELDLNSHISYTDASRKNALEPMLDSYMQLQEVFFVNISDAMGTDYETLLSLYQTYYANLPTSEYSFLEELNQPWNYIEINTFDNDANDFINSFFEGLASNKDITISEYYYKTYN